MARKLFSLWCIFCLAALLAPPPAAQAQDDVTWLFNQINSLRASLRLSPYTLNAQLSAAATQHSQYMAAGCDISHTESNGSTPASRAQANGYTGDRVSENIYGGSIARATDAWDFWIHSPIHYAGLTSSYVNEIGIGVASGTCNTFTLDFGHQSGLPAPAAPAGGNPGAAPTPVPPRPTRYVPPPPTRTPTPTIPTLTPSATWTVTPSRTPSATLTLTALPPSAAPLVLPTVPAPTEVVQPVAVVLAASPVEVPSLAPVVAETIPASPPVSAAPDTAPRTHQGFKTRDLVPFALVAQLLLIGLAGFAYFRRSR